MGIRILITEMFSNNTNGETGVYYASQILLLETN